MSTYEDDTSPLFSAVATSPKQIFHLLRCINFSDKAKVEIGRHGIKFSAEDSRALQGSVLLQKSLFTSYVFEPSSRSSSNSDSEKEFFELSLAALLETLQIFNLDSRPARSASTPNSTKHSAFTPQSLGTASICRFNYSYTGAPLQLIMIEAGITTTCNLNTYETEQVDEIPFQRTNLDHKIITKSDLLHDALQELSSTSPSRLSITVSPETPFFSLSSTGDFGSATVEFARDTTLMETFVVKQKTTNVYKFSMVSTASRAMALASKVSVRGDEQGVMNLQFLIDDEGSGSTLTFVDFFFVPFLEEDDEDEDYEAHDLASD